jgi:membrane protein implicated in regulation of membrane protease activity
MGLLEIMLEAGIAAQLIDVNPKIVLGITAPIVFFSVWGLTRWTRKRVTRSAK